MARNPKTPSLNILAKSRIPQSEERLASAKDLEIDLSTLDEGLVRPIGIGLTENERLALDYLAEKYQVTRHALLKVAVLELLTGVMEGRINIDDYFEQPEMPKKKLKKAKR